MKKPKSLNDQEMATPSPNVSQHPRQVRITNKDDLSLPPLKELCLIDVLIQAKVPSGVVRPHNSIRIETSAGDLICRGNFSETFLYDGRANNHKLSSFWTGEKGCKLVIRDSLTGENLSVQSLELTFMEIRNQSSEIQGSLAEIIELIANTDEDEEEDEEESEVEEEPSPPPKKKVPPPAPKKGKK
jgi:hypothetical protein